MSSDEVAYRNLRATYSASMRTGNKPSHNSPDGPVRSNDFVRARIEPKEPGHKDLEDLPAPEKMTREEAIDQIYRTSSAIRSCHSW